METVHHKDEVPDMLSIKFYQIKISLLKKAERIFFYLLNSIPCENTPAIFSPESSV